MWKTNKLFSILLSGEKIHRARTNALKLMGNWYNVFAEDAYSLR